MEKESMIEARFTDAEVQYLVKALKRMAPLPHHKESETQGKCLFKLRLELQDRGLAEL